MQAEENKRIAKEMLKRLNVQKAVFENMDKNFNEMKQKYKNIVTIEESMKEANVIVKRENCIKRND